MSEPLHAAVCQAVALLNVCPEGARIKEVRDAHNILRVALAEYTMDQPVTEAEIAHMKALHKGAPQ